MKLKPWIGVIAITLLSSCASKKVATTQKIKRPAYQHPSELMKTDQCSKEVQQIGGSAVVVLHPSFQLAGEDADILCVQKLEKGKKILKVTSKLDPVPGTEDQFLATAFNLVVYDPTMSKTLPTPKPVQASAGTSEFVIYYNFSKLKKFPAYLNFVFKKEDRQTVLFKGVQPLSKGAESDHGAFTGTAAIAMGGVAAGSAVSVTRKQAKPLEYTVFTRAPGELKAEWVNEISGTAAVSIQAR